ncbi:glycosyltransferase family 39 protein [Candidatus Riflebacteria bacterium]
MIEVEKKEIPSHLSGFRILSLAGILLVSLFLNLWNNDFPLGYHVDESKKTHFILRGKQDFLHPILMLNSVRFANYFLHYKDRQKVVELGRSIMAGFAMLICLAFFFLVRSLLPHPYALLATFSLAVTPILVVHAHYLKEDICLTFFTLLSIITFFSLVKDPQKYKTLLLGLALGMAISSHYKGLLLIPLFLVATFLRRVPQTWTIFARTLHAIPIALWVFLVINYPLFENFSKFINGLYYNINRIQIGYGPKIYPLPNYFCYHLLNSIVPGITWPLAIFSLFATLFFILKWKQLSFEERFFIFFIFLFYFAVEISPMKPTGFIRYVLPLIPVLIYFVFSGFYVLEQSIQRFRYKALIRVIITLAVLFSLQRSLRLIYYFNKDTRSRAKEYIVSKGGKTFYGWFSSIEISGNAASQSLIKLFKKGYHFVVVSSFQYEKYNAGLSDQPAFVYRSAINLEKLFKLPFVEIKPEYMSFSYSNPTIRIVDIDNPLVEFMVNFIDCFPLRFSPIFNFFRRTFRKTFSIFSKN